MRLTVGRCRVPELLAAKEWSQKYLSDHTGIDQSTISSYCTRARVHMPLLNAVLIADALGVNERDLYEWDYVKIADKEASNQ